MKPVSNLDKLQIGDLIPSAGIYTNAGVIVEKKENGQVRIDTSQETIEQYHKYGDTSGLSQEDKIKFNEVMKDVTSIEDHKERLEVLQQKIDDLSDDLKNKDILRKLSIRQRDLIRQLRTLPRFYEFDSKHLNVR